MSAPPEKPPSDDDKPDWLEAVVRIAGALGFNQVRVRWKLQGWRHRMQSAQRRRERRAAHVRYRHKTCARCGAVSDRTETHCSACGHKLPSRAWQLLQRSGLTAPEMFSVSALLGAALVLVYGRVAIAASGESIFSLANGLLVSFGANFFYCVEQGQWWRWLTAIYLHAGLLHIGFNLYALTIIGPHVEHHYGKWTSLGVFVVTGVLGNLGGWVAGMDGVGIGASGGIMGLLGVTIGHAHRGGTSADLLLRNAMLKWCAYIFVFGLFVNADHWAHLFGLLPGAAFGYALAPKSLRQGPGRALTATLVLVGIAATVIGLSLILFAPQLVAARCCGIPKGCP